MHFGMIFLKQIFLEDKSLHPGSILPVARPEWHVQSSGNLFYWTIASSPVDAVLSWSLFKYLSPELHFALGH